MDNPSISWVIITWCLECKHATVNKMNSSYKCEICNNSGIFYTINKNNVISKMDFKYIKKHKLAKVY